MLKDLMVKAILAIVVAFATIWYESGSLEKTLHFLRILAHAVWYG
jgi:hypothetical protein